MLKYGKRFISSLLVVAMLISGLTTVAFAEESSQADKVVMTEDFQSCDVGASTVKGYSCVTKGNEWKITEEDGNKFYAMTVNTSSDAYFNGTLPEVLGGKFVFQFDIRFRDYGPVEKLLYFAADGGGDIFTIKFNADGTMTTNDGTFIANYALNKFYTVTLEMDADKDTMSVKFNNKWRRLNHPVDVRPIKQFRFHMRYPSGVSTVDFDNLLIYTGKYRTIDLTSSVPTTGETENTVSYEIKKDICAMYVGKSSTLVRGEQVYMAPGDDVVVPYKNGDIKMIPVSHFVSTLGGKTVWNGADKSVTMTAKGKTATIYSDSQKCLVDGVERTLSCAAEIGPGNAMCAPAKDLCEIFDQFFHEEINGLIIYSDNDYSKELDWTTNLKVMRNICESFMFDDVTGKEMSAMIEANHPGNHHPRLIMTEEKFAKIRAEINDPNGDEVYKKLFQLLKKNCDKFMEETTSGYEIRDGIRLFNVAVENGDRMLSLALMYNLTGDEKYARRAYEEMYVSSCFVDFNPYHFLDVGLMASYLGLSYDWMYNWMDDSQRRKIRESIVKKGVYPIIEDFDNLPRKRSWDWRGELADNWCLVISGVCVGAMAVVDETEGLDRINCERAMEQTLIDMRRALSLFAPYGAYEEGFGYWDFAMRYFVQTLCALDTAIGKDFGYKDVVGMEMTDQFIRATNGSVSIFAYHDGNSGEVFWPSPIMWLASAFNKPDIAKPRIDAIMKGDANKTQLILDIYLYDPIFNQSHDSASALDTALPIAEIATMRSGFDQDDMWLGFHCDNPMGDGGGHDHMDCGVFVLDSQGVNWFEDLGKDDYNISNYAHCYRKRGEGHNVVIFNPTSDYSFKKGGSANLEKTEFAECGGYAIGNLDNAYRDDIGVISYKRGAKLDDLRRVATIQDEIRLSAPAEMYWFAHTKADIDVAKDGKSAILSYNGKKLLAKIVNGDGATFSVMDAKPLPTSPQIPEQNPNNSVRKLTIHMPSVQEIDLCVSFADYTEAYYEGLYNFEYIPISQWKAPEGEMPDTSYAELTGIYLDGKLIEDFDPHKFEYYFESDSLDDLNKVITATGEGEVLVSPSSNPLGSRTVLAKGIGTQRPRAYVLKFNLRPTPGEPEGKTVIKPVDIKVSHTPQAQNVAANLADDKLDTKWAAIGIQWLEYDLGSVKDLDSLGIVFLESTTRTAQFEILTSEDGENYTQWFDGDSLNTPEFANHKLPGAKARYVKVIVKGYNNSTDNWNSVMEVRVYGK